MSPLRAALFDYDGVLADSLADMLRFAGETGAAMGVPVRPTAADLDALGTMSFVEYGRRLGIPADRAEEFARRAMARFERAPSAPAIFPGMRAVVRQAAERGHAGIVTGSPTRAVLRFLRAHALEDSIDVLIPVEHPGSRAEKLRSALARLGRAPEEACFVGDAVSDVRACRQAGLTSIGVSWGHQRAERLAAAGADQVVASPSELSALLLRIS